MALDETLENGKLYRSPVDFLEAEENDLPEEQEYWLQNSTGNEWTFESLPELKNFLENLEDEWGKYRDFRPVESDSDRLQFRKSAEAEYFGIEFPYVELETDHYQRSAGQTGKVSFGYLAEKDAIEEPINEQIPRPADD